MVSTTLTTLAAGQSSMTSSTNLHNQQQQQRTQSALTAATTTAAANNTNYQRSASSSITTTTTSAAAATAEATNLQRIQNNNNYNSLALNGNNINSNNNNNNNNNSIKSNNNLNFDSGEVNHNSQGQQQQIKEENIYQNYNTFNGKRRNSNNNGANVTPAVNAVDETTKYETSNQYETAKSSTAAAAAVSASAITTNELLISASPPLNDQISLLFPKCRPKQQQQSYRRTHSTLDENSSHQINGNDSEPTTLADVNLLMLNDDDDNNNNQFSLHYTANNNKKELQPTTTRTTTNFYKNVNIITQSPPPPSTSSVSSESLSSVTPRISTNPFLCGTNSDEEYITIQQQQPQQQQQQQQQQQRYRTSRNILPSSELLVEEVEVEEDEIEEEIDLINSNKAPLPVSTYNSFYYHTSGADIPSVRASSDMPRKRVAYNPGFHHQHQPQQPQQQQNLKTNEDAAHCSPSNPFLKDNNSYWDRETSAAPKSNGVKTTGHLNDSGTELDAPRQTQLGPSTSRRTYHHYQPYGENGSDVSGNYNCSGVRNSQHPATSQHHRPRLSASSVQRYSDHIPSQQQSYPQRKYDTLPASKRIYQQQLYQSNKMSTPQAHGEATLSNNARYIYGSSNCKSSSMDAYGSAGPIDYWEKREKAPNRGDYECGSFADREEDIDREIERERERQRDRGDREDRNREYDWERVREATRIRDWEHEGIRNWKQEREFERRRELDRERERRERFCEPVEEEARKRKHEYEHVVRDIYEIGQKQLRQQKIQRQQQQQQQQQQKQPNNYATMMSNGEIVVFDDINESWQNLRVTTEQSTLKTSPTMATNGSSQVVTRDHDRTEYDDELIFKELKRSAEKSYTMSLETRHGIIEYEGSPRRIGGVAPEESTRHIMATSSKDVQDVNKTTPKTLHTTPICSSPSQYPARPGFPQRIISPPRDSTPPILLAAGKNSTNQQQSQRHNNQTPQQQQPQSQSLPQQSSGEYNTEDTSNDVSEIGTISDMHTPEAISPTVMVAAEANSLKVKDSTLGSTYSPSTSFASSTLEGTNTLANSTPKTKITTTDKPTTATTTVAAAAVAETPITTTTTSNTLIDSNVLSIPTKSSTFDYLYEFSETRKVLEEFFKCPSNEDEKPLENCSDADSIDIQYEFHTTNLELDDVDMDNQHIEADEDENDPADELDNDNDDKMTPQLDKNTEFKLALQQQQQQQQYQNMTQKSSMQQNRQKHVGGKHQRRHYTGSPLMRSFDFFLDSTSRSSADQINVQDNTVAHHNNAIDTPPNYRYTPDTTDYDSNCGDLDSLSGDIIDVANNCSKYTKYYENNTQITSKHDADVLSSSHTTDTENNNPNDCHVTQKSSAIHRTPHHRGGISMLMDSKRISNNNSRNHNSSPHTEIDVEDINRRNSLHTKAEVNMSSYAHMSNEDDDGMEESSDNRLRDSKGRELLGNSSSSNKVFKNIDPDLDSLYSISVFHRPDMVQMTPPPPAPAPHRKPNVLSPHKDILQPTPYVELRATTSNSSAASHKNNTSVAAAITSTLNRSKLSSSSVAASRSVNPPPPPIPERNTADTPSPVLNSPVWLPRQMDYSANQSLLDTSATENHGKPQSHLSADEDEIDTDLETDRLLGHQRLDDQGYYDENKSWDTRKTRSSLLSKISPKQPNSTKTRNGYNALLSSTPEILPPIPPKNSKLRERGGSIASASSSEHSDKSPIKSPNNHHQQSDDVRDECMVATINSPGGRSVGSGCISAGGGGGSGGGVIGNGNNNINNYKSKDSELLESNNNSQNGSGVGSISGHGGGGGSLDSQTTNTSGEKKVKKSKNKEGGAVLIEGVLFRAKYLGSTQLVCEGQPTKSTRMMQAEEAVSRIKALAPDGDAQPSTEVDLFISTEKIMVLNTDLKEIMMDHALRTISYIADIGDLVVLMARRRFVPQDIDDAPKPNRTPKMICHVFESDEAQFIAQSIGQAFQVAYMEFLKANGIEDHSFVKEMDYQEVLNSQEIFGDELEIFAKKELQKEVVVPKAKGEILGVVIVESGWGSMLPTVVIANLMSSGAAARCGQLNIGDQLIAINGLSLVGLPLSTCQNYIKNTKNQTVVKFTVVPCAPVVEVKIKRPNTKYQLGFSVQNGVICSLLRGGIAERGGVRVGHRIIEINNQSVVAVPHEKIVNLLATSVGEILMKTMPTSMFRLLTGQENPIYI